MYSQYPPADRTRLKVAYTIVWLLCAAAGVAIVIDPGWTAIAVAPWVIVVGGALLAASSLGAAVLVIASKYRHEQPLAWAAFVGAAPYTITSWWILSVGPFPPAVPGLMTAILSTILLSYPLIRSIIGLAYSNRLRVENRLLSTLSTRDVEVQIRTTDQGE